VQSKLASHLPHDRRSSFLVPLDPAANPVHSLLNTRTSQRTQRQDSAVSYAVALLSFNDSAYQALFDSDNLYTVFGILLVRQHQQRNALSLLVLQDRLQHYLAFLQASHVCFCVPRTTSFIDLFHVCVSNIRAVDHKDDRVTAAVVALPQAAERMLSTYVPDLKVALIEGNQADILADGRNSVQSRIMVRVVQALYLLEQSSFAGIVKAEEEDRVFWQVIIVSDLRSSVV
jgi:hypothetical protein